MKKLNKKAIIRTSLDVASVAATIVLTVAFLIILTVYKQGPENTLDSSNLQLKTDAALLNFLRIPVPSSSLQGSLTTYATYDEPAIYQGAWKFYQAEQSWEGMTVADMIVLSAGNNHFKGIIEGIGEQFLDPHFGNYWEITITYPSSSYSFGFSVWDTSTSFKNDLENRGVIEINTEQLNKNNPATAYTQLIGLDNEPILIQFSTWVIASWKPKGT